MYFKIPMILLLINPFSIQNTTNLQKEGNTIEDTLNTIQFYTSTNDTCTKMLEQVSTPLKIKSNQTLCVSYKNEFLGEIDGGTKEEGAIYQDQEGSFYLTLIRKDIASEIYTNEAIAGVGNTHFPTTGLHEVYVNIKFKYKDNEQTKYKYLFDVKKYTIEVINANVPKTEIPKDIDLDKDKEIKEENDNIKEEEKKPSEPKEIEKPIKESPIIIEPVEIKTNPSYEYYTVEPITIQSKSTSLIPWIFSIMIVGLIVVLYRLL